MILCGQIIRHLEWEQVKHGGKTNGKPIIWVILIILSAINFLTLIILMGIFMSPRKPLLTHKDELVCAVAMMKNTVVTS
ncbi:hypothetical protein HMPREF3107_09245 [Neisseria sp. HMSC31F04]|nr:hypothetical protein HMPREF3107_09245 [Neisseria sp. HMSC31F04]